MLNKDIVELKNQSARLQGLIANHEKNEEGLRDNIKQMKEDLLKGEMKGNGIQKEYERFKEQLQETITSTFSQIPLNQDLKSSNVSEVFYKRDGSSSTFNNTDIINKISSQNKEIKIAMSKLLEQNKILKNQNEKLSIQIQNLSSRSEATKSGLEKEIETLEEQLGKLKAEKEEKSIKYEEKINEINEELDKKEQ